jgi:peptidoglycan/LPS O-acetylase OafA/YrhL
MKFSHGLQGLRGVAIVLVFACHLRLVPGGWVGVDVFFVLSGYLITSLLIDGPPLRRFYAARARRRASVAGRRLLPALILLLAIVAIVGGSAVLPNIARGASYSMNLLRLNGASF